MRPTPAVDARIEVGPVPEGEADGAGPVFRGPEAGAGIVGGEGLAGLPVDLQGPEDAFFIADRQAGGGFGVYLPELAVKGLDALPGQLRLKGFSNFSAAVSGGKGAA